MPALLKKGLTFTPHNPPLRTKKKFHRSILQHHKKREHPPDSLHPLHPTVHSVIRIVRFATLLPYSTTTNHNNNQSINQSIAMSGSDYEQRVQEYNLAPLSEVKHALEDPATVVLDVRTAEEIAATNQVSHPHWHRINGTPDACPDLATHPEQFVPEKTATVVVYCRSGRRAARAKQELLDQGYTGTILNAGGYDDLSSILP